MKYQRHGSGPAVVLVPGLAATMAFFDRVVADLSRDHTVVTVDLPGHGATGLGRGRITLERTAADLHAVIEELDLNEVTVVGWSLGATVAYTYIKRFGTDRIVGLVSVEQTPYLIAEDGWEHTAFGTLDTAGSRDLMRALEADTGSFVENTVRNSFAADTEPDENLLAELVAQARTCDPEAIRSLLMDVLEQDWRKRVTTITTPTLLIHGAKSKIYPTEVGRWLADAFRVSRLELFEQSGHLPFIEEAEKFSATVRSFVAHERVTSRMTNSVSAQSARRLCWIYPDRGTVRQRAAEAAAVWTTYERIAADVGLRMSSHKAEDLAVEAVGDGPPRVFLSGEEIMPEDTILVTSLWSLPHQTLEVCNELFAYTIVEQAGFYLPIHPRLSYITTDKMATMLYLSDCPVPRIPTSRIGAGRDAPSGHYAPVLENLSFPLLVKPAYWGMGMGVCLAQNMHELRGIIGIAGGSDTALVVQPYLGEGVNDFRVYVVEGKAHTVLRRIPQGSSLTANLVNGGQMEYVPLPPELSDAIDYVASRLPMPYFAADFLFDGERFWLSEVEPDGAVGYATTNEVAAIQRPIIEARFKAYLVAHADWIAQKAGAR